MVEREPHRKYPAHGVFMPRSGSTIVFLTVCTKHRRPWLANDECHALLLNAWGAAHTWAVGRYVLMPDHVHLFAAPINPDVDLGTWVRFWKTRVSRTFRDPHRKWQKDYWDTRLRTGQSYEEKWQYVLENPVRHKLVGMPEEWPYQGEVCELRWP